MFFLNTMNYRNHKTLLRHLTCTSRRRFRSSGPYAAVGQWKATIVVSLCGRVPSDFPSARIIIPKLWTSLSSVTLK